jgi:hypothetical protein
VCEVDTVLAQRLSATAHAAHPPHSAH